MPPTDPRVLFAITLISLGITTADKLHAMWKAHGMSDADLDAIMTEAKSRIAAIDAESAAAPADPTGSTTEASGG